MTEALAYGYTCGILSRRIFVLGFSAVMAVLCYLQLARWFFEWNFLDSLVGRKTPPVPLEDCTGTECYEVFSCFGMKDASYHAREPLTSLGGAVAFSLALHGAMHGERWPLQVLTTYLVLSFLLHVAVITFDAVYLETCGAYSLNVVLTVLLPSQRLPPPLLSNAVLAELSEMRSFSVREVDEITGGFHTTAWYFSAAGAWALVLGFAALEAGVLADVAERGPLGLGTHFGIQWDEVIDWEAYRRRKERLLRSDFVEDAQLPLQTDAAAGAGGGGAPHGYTLISTWGRSYGALDAAPMPWEQLQDGGEPPQAGEEELKQQDGGAAAAWSPWGGGQGQSPEAGPPPPPEPPLGPPAQAAHAEDVGSSWGGALGRLM